LASKKFLRLGELVIAVAIEVQGLGDEGRRFLAAGRLKPVAQLVQILAVVQVVVEHIVQKCQIFVDGAGSLLLAMAVFMAGKLALLMRVAVCMAVPVGVLVLVAVRVAAVLMLMLVLMDVLVLMLVAMIPAAAVLMFVCVVAHRKNPFRIVIESSLF
jgi:hypothetical protein